MGNYISCTLSTTLNINGSHSKTATKVVLPNNEIRNIGDSPYTTAADLMLEFPGLFLVNSCSLHIGCSFNALSADEELEVGNVYVMFPMHRLNSLIVATDVAPLFLAARKSLRRNCPSPSPPPMTMLPRNEETAMEFKNRRLNQSRTMLHTIAEETPVT